MMKRTTSKHQGIWAAPVDKLDVANVPSVSAINIQGRHAIGALQGFGQLWKKTYRVRLAGVDQSASQVAANLER
jgi:hypothetical protein